VKVQADRAADRTRLPVPDRSRPFSFPAIEKSTLANGLRIWTVPHRAVPVVTIQLLVRRGSADDPAGKEGLAAITVDMLDEGSRGRSAIEIHEALARIGTHLESDIGSDASIIGTSVLSRFALEAMHLLADITVHPSLGEADFDRVRQFRLNRLRQLRDLPSVVADRAFVRLLYDGHPYGHTPLGTSATLEALRVDDVRTFHTEKITPSDATLVVVGDCEHDAVATIAADAFGGWSGSVSTASATAAIRRPSSRLSVIGRPLAPQSELRIGHVTVDRSTPDYHALVAANMILGGQFVSRINLNLREGKGITYGARTAFDLRRRPGPFSLQVSVDTAATAVAVRESIDEIAAIRGPRPVTPDELALGVATLTRGYARGFETAEQIARALTQIALYDLPDTYYADFVPAIERLTPDDVTRVAATHLDPAALTTLIVGDVDRIVGDLDQLNIGKTTVLPLEPF
jgi:predicted Zn-dependent peptidase